MEDQNDILAEGFYETIGVVTFRNRDIFNTLCHWAARVDKNDSAQEVEDKAIIRKLLKIKTPNDLTALEEEIKAAEEWFGVQPGTWAKEYIKEKK